MKKNLLVILVAGLLLLSATACKKDPENPEDTNSIDTTETTGGYIGVETDTDGNPTTTPDTPDDTDAPETDAFDPSEDNAVFTDTTMEIVVVSSVATVRTDTQVESGTEIGWPKEGKVLTVTGVSENWYRIIYPVNGEDQTCYIAKSVAGDTAIFDTFTEIEGGELVEVTAPLSLNVRSYPSADYSDKVSVRGNLAKGAQVTRVAVSENWSRILYEVTLETETNEDGTPATEVKEYYVSNKYIQPVETTTGDDTAEETETATETVTEAVTGENEQ